MTARSGAALLAAPLLALAALWHLSAGAQPVPPRVVLEALFAFDPDSFDHVIVREMRLPRTLIAASVGAGLSVAGGLMQGVTRNPLAEPGILGLLIGASLAVVLVVGVLGVAGAAWMPLVAAAGALAAALLVWGIALNAPGGATPMTLILAGAAVTAFLGALVTMANLMDERSFEELRVWLTGTLAGRGSDALIWGLPWLVAGLAVAFAVAPQVTALSMGEEMAAGLGVRITRLRAICLGAVVALTAAAVAMAGPLGFIGLVVPHAVRLFAGQDYARILPWAALAGATYLLIIDTLGRVLLAPVEISAGIITALLGAPVFVLLVRTRL